MGISKWDDELFVDNAKLSLDDYNFFVFFKFAILNDHVDMSSKIAFSYADNMPLIGLVTINQNFEESKITKDYLNCLFLQQFIKLLGFHVQTKLNWKI